MKDAEIVAIGTEILLGDLVDTNTPWLSRKLAALGVAVRRHTTVGDNKERIVAGKILKRELREEFADEASSESGYWIR
jgi:molybdopterin-biosynthesis enzyme MoeA-like protein